MRPPSESTSCRFAVFMVLNNSAMATSDFFARAVTERSSRSFLDSTPSAESTAAPMTAPRPAITTTRSADATSCAAFATSSGCGGIGEWRGSNSREGAG